MTLAHKVQIVFIGFCYLCLGWAIWKEFKKFKQKQQEASMEADND